MGELKHGDGPEASYRIQIQIRNWRTTGGTPSYDLVSLHFDSYEISQTEILKSTGGLDLLGKWIGLDPGLSSDETRISLIDVLCDRYYTEYANLCTLALQQGHGLERQTHNQFLHMIRRLNNIRDDIVRNNSSMG